MCLDNGSELLTERTATSNNVQIVSAADHHLHIQSDLATAEMRSVAERLPELFARLNPALLAPRDVADALAVLDDAGIEEGVLLSEGYIFSSPFATPGTEPLAAERTRLENQFNVDAALRSNGRLKAFVGINPFSAFALDELRHWAGRPGVTGVKLHLGNSGFDPKSDEHVTTLANFFEEVGKVGLAVLVHVRHAGPYDPSDTVTFIERVLSRAPGATIQIAHGGAGGGVGDAVEAITHFADAVTTRARGTEGLLVDLSCVLSVEPNSEEGSSQLARFAQEARRLGLDRIVMGSDWPTLCSPREHDALIGSQLPFTPEEWLGIANNRASYLT